MLQYKTTRKFTEQIPLTILTGFLTHDLEYTIALNNGTSESPGWMCDISEYKVYRESVRQLSIAPLNSVNLSKTWQRPGVRTQRVTKL